MSSEAVLVCQNCRGIFYRSVNRLIYHSVGRVYCDMGCYLADLRRPMGVQFGPHPEDCVLEQCDKELAQAIVKRAWQDGDEEFLYSEQGIALIQWAFGVHVDMGP